MKKYEKPEINIQELIVGEKLMSNNSCEDEPVNENSKFARGIITCTFTQKDSGV